MGNIGESTLSQIRYLLSDIETTVDELKWGDIRVEMNTVNGTGFEVNQHILLDLNEAVLEEWQYDVEGALDIVHCAVGNLETLQQFVYELKLAIEAAREEKDAVVTYKVGDRVTITEGGFVHFTVLAIHDVITDTQVEQHCWIVADEKGVGPLTRKAKDLVPVP